SARLCRPYARAGCRTRSNWLRIGADAQVLAPARVYVCLYAEAVSHVHFHLIPRDPGMPREHWGPGVFDLMSAASDQGRSLADLEASACAARAIRERLEATL